jgi:hypothetical protein
MGGFPVANLTPTQSKIPGVLIAQANASAGGDQVKADDRVTVVIQNTNAAAARQVTVVDPRSTEFGGAHPDPQTSIPALGFAVFGPFPARLADSSDGYVDFTYDNNADLKILTIRV